MVSKTNSGFTLIEMLVVIAIIGILSASVLVALGPSRDKAKDARIISGIKQAQAIIETLYNPTGGTPYTGISLTLPTLAQIKSDVNNNGGNLEMRLANGGKGYAIFSRLNTLRANGTERQYYCVENSGKVTMTYLNPTDFSGTCVYEGFVDD
jgi:prepilin-type N-terminal cleavage/methylation domain-containing protein